MKATNFVRQALEADAMMARLEADLVAQFSPTHDIQFVQDEIILTPKKEESDEI